MLLAVLFFNAKGRAIEKTIKRTTCGTIGVRFGFDPPPSEVCADVFFFFFELMWGNVLRW